MSQQRESAMPCGCDPGASPTGHICDWHATQLDFSKPTRRDAFLAQPVVTEAEIARAVPSPDTFVDVTARKVPVVSQPERQAAEQHRVQHQTLPTQAGERKKYPIASGVLDYFPDAIAAIAHVSYMGSQQHHPNAPLHWDRNKSRDQSDTLMRHFLQRGLFDTDGLRHSAKTAWRALAILQLEIEESGK